MRASLTIFTKIFCISFNILLVILILCRYKLHVCRFKCTDKFPNVPTKLRKSIIGGGAPCPPPPPPSGYASAPRCSALVGDPWTGCLNITMHVSNISLLNEHELKKKMLSTIQTSLK